LDDFVLALFAAQALARGVCIRLRLHLKCKGFSYLLVLKIIVAAYLDIAAVALVLKLQCILFKLLLGGFKLTFFLFVIKKTLFLVTHSR